MPKSFANQTLRGRPFKPGIDLRGANFQRTVLRGVNFKSLDLSGADFSGADIRGANFSKAVLVKANFTGAKAGLQKRWIALQLGIAFLASALMNFVALFITATSVGALFNTKLTTNIVPGSLSLILFGVSYFVIAIEGFTKRAVSTIAVVLTVLAAVAVFTSYGVIGVVLSVVVVVAGSVIVAVVSAFAVVDAGVFAFTGAGVGAFAVAFGIIIGGKTKIAGGEDTIASAVSPVGAIVGAFALLLLSFYTCWRVSQEDEKFTVIRTFGVVFGSWRGTSFCGSDLTYAVFVRATLKNTNFQSSRVQPTHLSYVDWTETKYLNRARVEGSILTNRAVRELLVSRRGHNKNYYKANLSSANLTGVDLAEADLTRAELSNALLHKANLKEVNLRGAIVLGADFSGAYLTGACIETWNIDAKTILENVDCQHIFLLEKPNIDGNRERLPSSGSFAPGEFTKLFQEILNTIVFIFQDGIDWKAFVSAFKTLQVQNQDTELTIQSIENKGDGVVVVRVDAPLDANKEKIHSEFIQSYEADRKALEKQYKTELQAQQTQIAIYKEQNANLWITVNSLSERPINNIVEVKATAESKSMNHSTDSSRKISIGNVGGDFNASGSALNLGDISGTVTNTLHQLQTAIHPNAPQLADLLQQLQTAIHNEPTLPDEDKAEALTEVNVLAEAAKNPQKETQQKKANTALEILKTTIAALPPTAALVEACSKLLPVITKLLGL